MGLNTATAVKIRSTKFETRNKPQLRIGKCLKRNLSFGYLDFEIVSDFDIRISDFLFNGV